MKYVRLIRRIDMINRAVDRTPDDDRHEALLDALWVKRVMLIKELKGYIMGGDTAFDNINREARYCRRRQVKLACKLLDIRYNSVVV
jgi:hypothetical protein